MIDENKVRESHIIWCNKYMKFSEWKQRTGT